MEQLINNLGTSFSLYAPSIISAVVLIIVAYIVALVLKAIVTRVLTGLHVDERFGKHVSSATPPTSLAKTIGNIVFWLVIFLFLPAILGALNFPGLLAPVQNMINTVLSFLPNILGAALIFIVGWVVARIVSRVVTSLLAAAGVDRLGDRVGVSQSLGSQRLSNLIGTVVYFLILIPVLIAALNALQLNAITQPASAMLNNILLEIPNIFAAFLILAIAYVVGRVISGLVSSLLAALGFNTIFARLGLNRAHAAIQQAAAQAEQQKMAAGVTRQPTAMTTPTTPRTPSEVVGYVILVAIMYFALIEALRALGFVTLADLASQLLVLAGQIAMGLIIFAIGLWLANLAAQVIQESDSSQAPILAPAARIAILVLAGAMALRQMGLANEIVNLAFGLMLGAIAVAVALAFGLGGRDTASQLLRDWRGQIEEKTSSNGNAARQAPRVFRGAGGGGAGGGTGGAGGAAE